MFKNNIFLIMSIKKYTIFFIKLYYKIKMSFPILKLVNKQVILILLLFNMNT